MTRINNQSRTFMNRIIPLTFVLGFMMQPCASGQEDSPAPVQWKTQCGTPSGQQKFPVESYRELPQFTKPSEAEWKDVKGIMASWGNTDTRYARTSVPMSRICRLQGLNGWRGEKVHAQAVVWTKERIERLKYELSEFRGPQGHTIPADRFETGFIRYVMTDELNEGGGGCGHRPDHTVYDSTMVADCIDFQEEKTGRREEGTIYATYSLFRKLAQGIGQAIVSLALALTGYVEATGAVQTQEVADNIYTMTGALPLIGSIICFFSMLFLYKFGKDSKFDCVSTGDEDPKDKVRHDD